MKNTKAITKDDIERAMREARPASLTGLAKALGYKGSIGGGLAKTILGLVPGIEEVLATNKAAKQIETSAKEGTATVGSAGTAGSAGATAMAPTTATAATAKAATPKRKANAATKPTAKPAGKPAPKAGRKWKRDPRNVYREGSAYATCFDILSSFKSGVARTKLVELLAAATGKDVKHAGWDAHVVLTAWGNEPGLSRNDGPRHKSARPGYWVKRENGHVTLVVD
jgi:hypothetical protein